MSKNQSTLTVEDRKRIGRRLNSIRQLLLGEGVELSAALEKVLEHVDNLRSDLDDVLASQTSVEQWDEEHLARVYYPANASTEILKM